MIKFVANKAKGRISKRLFQGNKARQIFQKTHISYPLICIRTCVCQGVRNVRFSGNLAYFVFLKHPFWYSHFCLITDELCKTYLFGNDGLYNLKVIYKVKTFFYSSSIKFFIYLGCLFANQISTWVLQFDWSKVLGLLRKHFS